MEKIKIAIFSLSLLFVGGIAQAQYGFDEPKKADLKSSDLRYAIFLGDGADIVSMFQKTQWLVDLEKTNLYRGLMLRVGGLLGALPNSKASTWEGKLSTYLLEKALKGRPIALSYFQDKSLVSPIGVTIFSLGQVEMKILTKIVESLRTMGNHGVTFDGKVGEVTPISLSSQKLAVAYGSNCISISRDPDVAFAGVANCDQKMGGADAKVRINVSSLASSSALGLKKFLGVTDWFEIQLKKESAGQYKIAGGEMNLASGSKALSNAPIPAAIGEILPANTLLFQTLTLPRPNNFTEEEITKLLSTKSGDSKFHATFFYLGTRRLEGGGYTSDTGILVPQIKEKPISVDQFVHLFQPYLGKEVSVQSVCENKAVLITQNEEVKTQVEQSCKREIPSMKNASGDIAKSLASSTGAHSMLVNFGKLTSAALDFGLEIDSVEKTKFEEVNEARALLQRLPAVHMVGSVDGSKLNYKAFTGVF